MEAASTNDGAKMNPGFIWASEGKNRSELSFWKKITFLPIQM